MYEYVCVCVWVLFFNVSMLTCLTRVCCFAYAAGQSTGDGSLAGGISRGNAPAIGSSPALRSALWSLIESLCDSVHAGTIQVFCLCACVRVHVRVRVQKRARHWLITGTSLRAVVIDRITL